MNFAEFVAKNKEKIRKVAESNTPRNSHGVPILVENDPWREEVEWEEVYKDLGDNS